MTSVGADAHLRDFKTSRGRFSILLLLSLIPIGLGTLALEDAVRQVSLREAMLREARAELEEAAGVGRPGRFTTQRIGEFELGNILGRPQTSSRARSARL